MKMIKIVYVLAFIGLMLVFTGLYLGMSSIDNNINVTMEQVKVNTKELREAKVRDSINWTMIYKDMQKHMAVADSILEITKNKNNK